jgi:hypothetical protein
MDDKFEDQWRADIVESYLHLTESAAKTPQPSRPVAPQVRRSGQSTLSAPALEKSDSQWSPLSSGLATPQDSLPSWWSSSPDKRRSGRVSVDGGMYAHSNRWSLGTQLSSVSFSERMRKVFLTDVVPSQTNCEDKPLGDKLNDWTTVESPKSICEESDGDDKIFHPDDEIILDTRESLPLKRVHPCTALSNSGEHRFSGTAPRMLRPTQSPRPFPLTPNFP